MQASQATARATSSGSPLRAINSGLAVAIVASCAVKALSRSDAMGPGAIVFARIP